MGDTGASVVVGFFLILAIFACTMLVGLASGFAKSSKPVSFITGFLLLAFLSYRI
jgi:cytochrome bd-type quinol oxidase subunit 1